MQFSMKAVNGRKSVNAIKSLMKAWGLNLEWTKTLHKRILLPMWDYDTAVRIWFEIRRLEYFKGVICSDG